MSAVAFEVDHAPRGPGEAGAITIAVGTDGTHRVRLQGLSKAEALRALDAVRAAAQTAYPEFRR